MDISELDERTITIIDTLLNSFTNDFPTNRHFIVNHTWGSLNKTIEGLKFDEVF